MTIFVPGANFEKSTRTSERSVVDSLVSVTTCALGRNPPSDPISVSGTTVPALSSWMWYVRPFAAASIRNRYCWRFTLRFGHTLPLTRLTSESSPGAQYAFLKLSRSGPPRGNSSSPSVKNAFDWMTSGTSNSPLGSGEFGPSSVVLGSRMMYAVPESPEYTLSRVMPIT